MSRARDLSRVTVDGASIIPFLFDEEYDYDTIGGALKGAINAPSMRAVLGDAVPAFDSAMARSAAGSVVFMTPGDYFYQTQPMTDANILLVGLGTRQTSGIFTRGTGDGDAFNVSNMQFTQLMDTPVNQFNVFMAGYINTTGALAPYQKGILQIQIVQSDASQPNGRDLDGVGMQAVAEIATGNMTGRIFPIHAIARVRPGSDGYVQGFEIGVENYGSFEPEIDSHLSKYGMHLVASGAAHATAAIRLTAIGGAAKWHNGIVGRVASLNENLIRLEDQFVITKLGNIGIGTAAPGNAALHRKTTVGDATVVLETSDFVNGSAYVDFLRTAASAWSAGVDGASGEFRIAAGEGLAGSIRFRLKPDGGFQPPIYAADPIEPGEGDMWVNSTSHTIKAYLNGAVRTLSTA